MSDVHRLRQEVEQARDDHVLLGLLADRITDAEEYLKVAREERVLAARRLSDLGVPMTTIARSARVGDSYLGRLVTGR